MTLTQSYLNLVLDRKEILFQIQNLQIVSKVVRVKLS
jgi:hypothetical protein